MTLQQRAMSFISAGLNTGEWPRDAAYELVREMLNANWNSPAEHADARDAARYRWLRSADPMLPGVEPELLPTLDTTALDDGIDAAMARSAQSRT